MSPYLKSLLLTQKDILHAPIDFLRGGIRVRNLISSANLRPESLLEIVLRLLVRFDLSPEVPACHVDLRLNARVSRSGRLLDLLEQVAKVAEGVVDFILDVVQVLAHRLILLLGGRVQQGVLRDHELALSLRLDLLNAIVDLLALVQNRRGTRRLLLLAICVVLAHLGHLCTRQQHIRELIHEIVRSEPSSYHMPHSPAPGPGSRHFRIPPGRRGCTGRSRLGCTILIASGRTDQHGFVALTEALPLDGRGKEPSRNGRRSTKTASVTYTHCGVSFASARV